MHELHNYQVIPLHVLQVICEDFPDPYKARESFWVPFVKEKIGEPYRETPFAAAGAAEAPSSSASASTSRVFLVGHSSGSVCIMRLLETYKERPQRWPSHT